MNKRQKGQILPVGLALLAFGVMSALVLFNTGQVATDKMMLANTADAAAYSGSQWQARAMNFQSYTNRAMVANQVSIAQAVTLKSWVTYGAIASENTATLLSIVPVLNAVAAGAESALKAVEGVVSPVSDAMLNVVDVVNRGLSTAQQAMFVSTFVATPEIMKSVVSKTDPRFSIETGFSGYGLASNLNDWRDFTQGYTSADEAAMSERAGLISQSRDGFTQERNWKFFKNFWFYSSPLMRHRLYREGKTELIKVESNGTTQWEWKAKDTMSLHSRLWRWYGEKKYEVPIGWAEAFANTESSRSTIDSGACDESWKASGAQPCSRFLGMNRKGEYWADTGVRSSKTMKESRISMAGYTGLQAFRSMSQAAIDSEVPHVQLKIEVALPVEKVSSTSAQGMQGKFSTPVDAPGKRISSISVSEVFYQRPDADTSPDRALEKANAYNPYWSARLSKVLESDRLLAFSLRPHSGSTSAPGGLPSTINTLGEYEESSQSTGVGTLASGYDTSLNPYSTDIAMIDTSLGRDFDDVVNEFGVLDIVGFENQIKSKLNDALKTAVKDILTGTVNDLSGGSFESDMDQLESDVKQAALDGVGNFVNTDAAQPYMNALAEAEKIASDLKGEFKRIRGEVSGEFQKIYEQMTTELNVNLVAIEESITNLRDTHTAYNEEDTENLQKLIREREIIAEDFKKDFKEDLARALVDIVSNATDLYVMPYKDAVYTVNEWMLTLEDDVILPWLDIPEDDIADE